MDLERAARRPDASDAPAVGADDLARRARERPAVQALARAVQPRVGERVPQPGGVRGDRAGAVERLGAQRVLVADLGVAERGERVRVAPRPRALPGVEQRV
jgi:hypothetical protein